jgi:hypothetical protein
MMRQGRIMNSFREKLLKDGLYNSLPSSNLSESLPLMEKM